MRRDWNHHLAVLGVTGSGKSVFSRNLIRSAIDKGKKIIAVDFTGEYLNKFADLNPYLLFEDHEEKGKS